MTTLVELDIYSSTENPVFILPEDEERAVLSQAAEIKSADAAPRSGLGYRGFRLREAAPKEGGMIAELAGRDSALMVTSMPDLESRLLDIARRILDLPGDLVEVAAEQLKKPVTRPGKPKQTGCPPCNGQTAPAFFPQWWNNDPVRLANNNCYNYANNLATNTFAQPGRATGRPITGLSCQGVQPSAQSDGLVPAPNFVLPTPGWYVALVIWPNRDYHWYRQDNTGCWSHKPGSTPVTPLDNNGNPITDPQTCARGPYTAFCSYMTTRQGVNIR